MCYRAKSRWLRMSSFLCKVFTIPWGETLLCRWETIQRWLWMSSFLCKVWTIPWGGTLPWDRRWETIQRWLQMSSFLCKVWTIPWGGTLPGDSIGEKPFKDGYECRLFLAKCETFLEEELCPGTVGEKPFKGRQSLEGQVLIHILKEEEKKSCLLYRHELGTRLYLHMYQFRQFSIDANVKQIDALVRSTFN